MRMSWSVGSKIGGGFGLALLILIVIGVVAYKSTTVLIENSRWVVHTDEVMVNLERLFSMLQDAETGQRGFLLTGAERYLAPYNDAVPRVQPAINEIQRLTADNPNQQRRIDALGPLVKSKLAELQETIDLRREKGSIRPSKWF
jgi:CHASE3 domain sensor protein